MYGAEECQDAWHWPAERHGPGKEGGRCGGAQGAWPALDMELRKGGWMDTEEPQGGGPAEDQGKGR